MKKLVIAAVAAIALSTVAATASAQSHRSSSGGNWHGGSSNWRSGGSWHGGGDWHGVRHGGSRFALGLSFGFPAYYYWGPGYYPYAYAYPYPYSYPSTYPAYPPQAYPPQAYPPQAYPPQAYPPSAYPPSAYPPASTQPGYPQSGYPPQGSIRPSQPNTGGISFEIQPSDARVYVDGQYVGTVGQFTATSQPLGLTAGRHHIQITAPGYRTMELDADIVAGEVLPYQGTLAR